MAQAVMVDVLLNYSLALLANTECVGGQNALTNTSIVLQYKPVPVGLTMTAQEWLDLSVIKVPASPDQGPVTAGSVDAHILERERLTVNSPVHAAVEVAAVGAWGRPVQLLES